MAKIQRKAKKMADGAYVPGVPGAPPITPQEREGWNNYQRALVSAPGRYVRNWDHNEDFQKQVAKQTGWDYSRNAAVQADMKSGSHAVSGVAGADPWGGNPNWAGTRESNKNYTKYQYEQQRMNPVTHKYETYYKEDRGTEAIPADQIAGFTDRAHQSIAPKWQTNDMGIPMDAPASELMKLPGNAQAYAPVDNSQAIMNRQEREADTTGRYDNMYLEGKGSESDYSIDAVRQAGDGGRINPWDSGKGNQSYRALYKTPLPNKASWPSTPMYAKGGQIDIDTLLAREASSTSLKRAYGGKPIRRYDPGGYVDPTELPPAQPSTYKPPTNTGVVPPAGMPGTAQEDPAWRRGMTDQQAQESLMQKPSQSELSAPAPKTSHNYVGFSTSGLLSAGLQGADALVTEAIYNPRMRAREAQMKRDMSMSVTGANDFYGHGMGMYKKGGRVGASSYAPYTGYGEGGVTDEDFESHPGNANALVESQEMVRTPDGETFPISGNEQHSDKPNGMGGKYMDFDPGTQIYSKRKMIDKNTASDITGSKIKRKVSPADLVRRYNTKVEDAILDTKLSDPIAVTTADFMKGIKESKKDQVFDAQERAKNPHYGHSMEFGGTALAKFGGKIMKGGGDDLDKFQRSDEDRFDPDAAMDYDPLTISGPKPLPIPEMKPIDMKELAVPDLPEPYDPDAPSTWGKLKNWAAKNVKGDANLRDAPLFAPEALATLHAMTDHPIWSPQFQPVYNKAHKLNNQADLNRNLSMAYPVFQRSYGSSGIGQRSAGLASLLDASNQLGQNKANYDSQQLVATDNANAAIENDSNWKRVQLANMLSDKMAQRQFNKDRSLENATESAVNKGYALRKGRRLEKNSVNVLNKIYPNWQWDQAQGLHGVDNGPWFHNPYGYTGGPGGGSFDPGDGIRDSETFTVGGKKYKRVESDRN